MIKDALSNSDAECGDFPNLYLGIYDDSGMVVRPKPDCRLRCNPLVRLEFFPALAVRTVCLDLCCARSNLLRSPLRGHEN